MGRLIVSEFVTLDGIMEAPGFEEHRSGRNAWALRLSDDHMRRYKREEVRAAAAILLGRTTYQIWAAFWPSLEDDEAFGRRMNEIPKYVISSTLLSGLGQLDDPPRRCRHGGRSAQAPDRWRDCGQRQR
jgi:dihydrofolate reductase